MIGCGGAQPLRAQWVNRKGSVLIFTFFARHHFGCRFYCVSEDFYGRYLDPATVLSPASSWNTLF